MPSLIKIFALLFAAVIFAAVSNSKSAVAQNRRVANFGTLNGSFHARPGFRNNRSFENFGHFRGRFRGGLGRDHRDFGPNAVVLGGVVAPPLPYYDTPPLGYDSMRCILHRQVETPKGLVSVPVNVC
jgi:hypothetical protein